VLVEGDYIAIAKNKDQIYQRFFSVVSGHDEDVSVIADVKNIQRVDDSMD
ncbi:MAG: carboxypeptidase regulatory-like domain-containing protein, partial [Bartonella sp.]|nr:carboxypeptidase regulatory-like domain-containing protein [Bartonella sp.]